MVPDGNRQRIGLAPILIPRPQRAVTEDLVDLADTPPHGLMPQFILHRAEQGLEIQGLRKGVSRPEQPGFL